MPIPTVISVAGTAARSDAKPFAAAGALGVVGIALDLARPWPLAIAIDHAIDGRPLFGWSPTTVLVLAAVALVALTAAAGLIDMAAELYSERAAERVGFRLRQELFDRAMTLSLRWHDRTRAGEVLSRLTTDVGRVLDALVAIAVTLVPDAVRLAVVLGLLITIDGQMYSFHASTAVRMPTVASQGAIRGSMMRLKIVHSLAPSTRAASIKSCGTSSNACLSSTIATAVTTFGRITPV